MPDSTSPSAPRVFLVGAGPGDPGYITLRGVESLAQADVVLYDYLVNPAILQHARSGAELVCLGHHGHTRIWSQEEINSQLVALSRAGKCVVRLKSGDATIFARVAEELDALTAAGITYEIVPGVTAALAAGSCAGIPLTHRDHASAVALITGREDTDKETSSLDFDALARFPGTLVFYMGVTTVRQWTTALIAAGKPPQTPAAIVRRCSFPDQQTIRCRLDEVAQRMTEPDKLRPPVIVVVGEVANLAEHYSWFEKRPLFGKRIVVTRPLEQCDALAGPLMELGAEVLVQPAIRIEPPEDWSAVDAALARLNDFDWIVFSSSNGVRMLMERLLSQPEGQANTQVGWAAGSLSDQVPPESTTIPVGLGSATTPNLGPPYIARDLRSLGRTKLAVIGPGTAEELARYHLKPDAMPADAFRAESLAAALGAAAKGKRFLLARASRGREVLAEELTAAGGIVEQVVVYRSEDVTEPDQRVAELLSRGKIDWITVTSSAIARSLANLFGDNLKKAKLVSISPITTATLRELGYEAAAEAREYTMAGVVSAIVGGAKRA